MLADFMLRMQVAKQEAHVNGTCIRCKEVAAPHIHTDAGRSEYQISGMCEDCFDLIFAEEQGNPEE